MRLSTPSRRRKVFRMTRALPVSSKSFGVSELEQIFLGLVLARPEG